MNKLILLLVLLSFNSYAQQSINESSHLLAFNTPTMEQQPNMPLTPSRNRGNCNNGYTVVATIFAGIGGGLIGYDAGTWIAGGETNWTLAAIGAGCVAVAIPFGIIGANRCKRYATTNHSDSYYVAKKPTKQLYFTSSGNTVGLMLNF